MIIISHSTNACNQINDKNNAHHNRIDVNQIPFSLYIVGTHPHSTCDVKLVSSRLEVVSRSVWLQVEVKSF